MQRILASPKIRECFVLETCNRIEWYIVTPIEVDGQSILQEVVPTKALEVGTVFSHEGSLEHLLRVAAGLESMVLGEDQILGQFKSACEEATEVDAFGTLLDEAVWKAIHCGERIRTETAINEGRTSLAQAAVELAAEQRPLESSSALVIGVGEMGTSATKTLAERASTVVVLNRTTHRAEQLASTLGGSVSAAPFEELEQRLPPADLIVSATGSNQPILTENSFTAVDEAIVIDLGQPRDVSPGVDNEPGIDRFDLDDLDSITAATHEERAAAAAAAERIVANELDHLRTRFKRNQADTVIARLYKHAESIKQRELQEAIQGFETHGEFGPEQQALLESFADALVGQLLAAPTASLRDAAEADDWETIQTALSVFDPEFESGEVEYQHSTDRSKRGVEKDV